MEDEEAPQTGQTDQIDPLPPPRSGIKHKRIPSYTTPPYWQRHRSTSSLTHASLDRPPPIRLEDNTEPNSPATQTLWAKSVTIEDYRVIQGNLTGIGAYIVWNCTVQTLDGGPMIIRKRYSEFDDLRNQIVRAFPQASPKSLPPLPPKSAIYKFRPKFLEKRRTGLEYFLNCVLLNPGYASSPMVKDFIFTDTQA